MHQREYKEKNAGQPSQTWHEIKMHKHGTRPEIKLRKRGRGGGKHKQRRNQKQLNEKGL